MAISRHEKFIRTTAFSLAIVLGGGALASCSGDEAAHRSATTTEASRPEASPSTSTSFDGYTYAKDERRNARIAEAVSNFTGIVLQESSNPNSSWGPFDTFCAPQGSIRFDTSDDGWVSHGHVPDAGDFCAVQHNPQYGGEQEQVMANVFVTVGPKLVNSAVGASIKTPECGVMLDYNEDLKSWSAELTTGNAIKSAETASSQTDAQAIDSQVINCLNTTRP